MTPTSRNIRSAAAMAAPLVAFFVIENVASLIVLARVGRLGATALAGLGLASAVFMGLLALLYGVDAAVQAQVARAAGARAPERGAQVMIEGVTVGATLGLALALLLGLGGPALLAQLIGGDAATAGANSLRGSAAGLVALGLTIPMNAYWIASGAPWVSLAITAISSAVNVALAWALAPAFGTAGAGAAASLGAGAGLVLQVAALLRWRGLNWLQRPSAAGLHAIVTLGWPISLQQALMQAVLVAAFGIIAQLGVAATAAASVLSSLTLFPTQVCAGAGLATAVLVGQSLGRGDLPGARRWGWRMASAGAAGMALIGLVAVLAPEPLLALFIHDPAVTRIALAPTRLAGLMLGMDAVGKILGYGLRGAGATRLATAAPLLFEGALQLLLLWWVGVKLRFGLTGMMASQLAMVSLTGVALAWIWRGAAWTRVAMPGLPAARALPSPVSRLLILGGAGAGKSTLARRLAATVNAPAVHRDGGLALGGRGVLPGSSPGPAAKGGSRPLAGAASVAPRLPELAQDRYRTEPSEGRPTR